MDFFKEVNNTDIVETIGRYATLSKKGANYETCCPFHNEKTPSMKVFPKNNTWHCFGCGEGTSAIDFVMKHKNMSAWEAACEIAGNCGIEIPKLTPEAKEIHDKKEKLYEALNIVHQWFVDQLKINKPAKEYLTNRWDEDVVSYWGMGYAPDGFELVKLANEKNISQELLKLGILKKNEKGVIYPFFQRRVIFPVHNTHGRLIAFTGRTMGADKPKYINTQDSELYTKGSILFGLNRAYRNIKEKKRLYLVEGNPDVITLHSIKKVGTVCTMGTALTDEQVSIIKDLDAMVIIIGDTDDAGKEATEKNAVKLINSGISVGVYSIKTENGEKQDPDSYFRNKDANFFNDQIKSLCKDYILAKVEKEAAQCENNASYKTQLIDECAKLISKFKDKQRRDVYINDLSKTIKPKQLWTQALNKYIANNANDTDFIKNRIPAGVSLADTEKYGFYEQNNCYFFRGKDGYNQGSNFVMHPLFHVQGMLDSKRLYKITNEYGYSVIIEIKQKDLVSLNGFRLVIESLGNFLWTASEIDMNRLKQYLYEKTETCKEVKQLGWNQEGAMFCWSNGIYNGEFTLVDDYGIAKHNGVNYYIPAYSKIYEKEDGLFVTERRFKHHQNGTIDLYQYSNQLIKSFGNNAKICLCFYIATLFKDFIGRHFTFFPILNLFGPKGTGKTEMAMMMLKFFGDMPKGVNMTNATLPSLADHVALTSNALCHIDEYKNSIDFMKIEFLKGLWDLTGRSRMNMDKDKKKETSSADCGIILSGQEMPTADIALYSRLIFLSFNQTEYTADEKATFMELQKMAKSGLTHITNEILAHRKYFVKHFIETYDEVMEEMTKEVNTIIEDRIMRNWCVALAAFRTLEDKIHLPFTWEGLKPIAAKFIKTQNKEVKKGSEVSIFWDIFQFLFTDGQIMEHVDFKMDYVNELKTDRLDKNFKDPVTVLMIRKERIFQLYRKHGKGTDDNILPLKTLEYYLINSPAYLGNKTQYFRRYDGASDGFNNVDNKRNRIITTAMFFDYEKLGINVATCYVDDNDSDFVISDKKGEKQHIESVVAEVINETKK